MRVPEQQHNASTQKASAPRHSVVGEGVRQSGLGSPRSPLLQTLSARGSAVNATDHAAILNRAPANRSASNQKLLVQLQRQYGNSYVNQILGQNQPSASASPAIQTKLTIGPVGDKYEREADQVASDVVQRINAPAAASSNQGQIVQAKKMPDEELQKKPQITAIQREVMPGEEEQQAQMKPGVGLDQTKKLEEEDKLKHLQKKADANPKVGLKEEEEGKLHAQKKSDASAEKGLKDEEDDKLTLQKKSQPDAAAPKEPEEDDKLMQAKSEAGAKHLGKDEDDEMAQMQPLVQRRSHEASASAMPNLETSIKQAQGKGRSLPESTRGSMEQAFGADFSGVRVHTDNHADQLNRSIQARAFTTGQNVFFRQGEFALGSKQGQELLAHELTHVVQQNGNAVQPKSINHVAKKANKVQQKLAVTADSGHEATAKPPEQTPSAPQGSSRTLLEDSSKQDKPQEPLAADPSNGKAKAQQVQQQAAGDEAPNSPEADPGYREVVSQAHSVGTQQKQHQPTGEKAQEAQEAAEPPSSEVESKAQDKQVDEMGNASTPLFDARAFKEALVRRIADITPKTLEEAKNFEHSNKLESVKNDVTGKVDEAQKDSKKPLAEKAAETPDTSGITPKSVTPLAANQPGEAPSINGAERAAPKAKGQSQVEAPAQARSQGLDQQLAEADITEEQLAKSNEPQFQAALDSKKTAQAHSATAPQAYRQGEQAQLSQAESTAAATTQEKLQGMHGERSQSLEQVTGKQTEGKGKDEQSRAQIAGEIGKIYDATKTKVDDKLTKLTTDVETAFDAGAAEAKKGFEDYVGTRMENYKEERYKTGISEIKGQGDKWTQDQLGGLPNEVNRFYEEGRDLYLKAMDSVIDRVIGIVGAGLNEAKSDVAKGREQVKDYVAKLPEELKQIGVEAAENIQSQFDGLEQDIDNKQDELIDTLAQKYKENLDAIDARIKEMQEENKGLIQKAVEFIVGVVKTIIELAKLLFQVLMRVASSIGNILKDPIGFLSNLFSALKQGFLNFVKNIGKYLTQGLLSWLTDTLAGANIQMPESLDAKGIFSLVTQVMGLTYDAIRAKAVKRLGKDGEQKVGLLEKSFEMFRTLATTGIAGVWQVVKDRLGDLKTLVLDPIITFLTKNVITDGIEWIIGLMRPASGFIKACKAIYDIVKFFIDHAKQIADLINSVLDAIGLVAGGAIDQASQAIENTLTKAIPLAISFLASLLGLGGIGEKVQAIIKKIRQPIEKAIDWVIDQGVKAYKKVSNKFKKSKLGKKFSAVKKKAKQKLKAAKQWGKNKQKAAKNWLGKKKRAIKDRLGTKENKSEKKLGEKQHKLLAYEAVKELKKTDGAAKDYKTLWANKEAQARQIENTYTAKLEAGIKLTIRFENATKGEKDGELDFQVKVAPNTINVSASIPINNKPTNGFKTDYHADSPHSYTGGKAIKAIVGKESKWPKGEIPAGGIPKVIDDIGLPIKGRYVAGHLMNEEIAGLADNANLTVLSVKSNNTHKGYENKLKKLGYYADFIDDKSEDLSKKYGNKMYEHGAEYTVKVGDPKPDASTINFMPESLLVSELIVSIRPIRRLKNTNLVEDWPEMQAYKKQGSVPNVPPYPPPPGTQAQKKNKKQPKSIAKQDRYDWEDYGKLKASTVTRRGRRSGRSSPY